MEPNARPRASPQKRVYVGFPDDYEDLSLDEQNEVCLHMARQIQEGLGIRSKGERTVANDDVELAEGPAVGRGQRA